MRLFELFEEKYFPEKGVHVGDDYWRDLSKYRKSVSQGYDLKPEFTQWPPSPAELKKVEGQVCQDPEWLAYWAYFGWRSWQQITIDKTFFKHNNTMVFYNVPAIANYGKDHPLGIHPDHIRVTFDINGKLLDDGSQWNGMTVAVPLPGAMDLLKHYMQTMFSPENRYFMQNTFYVRFGPWREDERSKNFLLSTEEDPVWEDGVSAYHADWDVEEQRWAIADGIDEDTINGTLSSLMDSGRKIYLVQGKEIGHGSDGEPVLKDLKIVKTLNIKDIYVPGIFDPPREDD